MLTRKAPPGSFPEHEPSTTPVARNADDATGVDPHVAAPHGGRYVHHAQHVYLGNHRKAVDVEVDGQWYDGELRSWDQADDRTWSGAVTWRRVAGELLLDRFPASRIREARVNESSG